MVDFADLSQGGWKMWGLMVSRVMVVIGGGFTVVHQFRGPVLSNEVGLKCSNPTCDYAQTMSLDQKKEMAKADYEKWKQANPGRMPIVITEMPDTVAMGPEAQGKSPQEIIDMMIISRWGEVSQNLPLTCPKCGQPSVYRATICEKCGTVFFKDPQRNPEYPDTCPSCGHSKRKAKKEAEK